MAAHEWQIAIFGTFDVENYGDLLFPILAEAALSTRLGAVKLHKFSYHEKSASDWPYTVTSLTELPELACQLDAILIGGGFLIRFDKINTFTRPKIRGVSRLFPHLAILDDVLVVELRRGTVGLGDPKREPFRWTEIVPEVPLATQATGVTGSLQHLPDRGKLLERVVRVGPHHELGIQK